MHKVIFYLDIYDGTNSENSSYIGSMRRDEEINFPPAIGVGYQFQDGDTRFPDKIFFDFNQSCFVVQFKGEYWDGEPSGFSFSERVTFAVECGWNKLGIIPIQSET